MRKLKKSQQKKHLFLIAAFAIATLYVCFKILGNSAGRLEYRGRYYSSLDELFETHSEVIGCGPRMTVTDLKRGYYDAREGIQIVCFSSHEESDNLYQHNLALRENYEFLSELNAD